MKNILLNGGPGTGKTFCSRAIAYYLCEEKLEINQVFNKNLNADYDKIEQFALSDNVEFIQIHTSISYEDIVYGIDIKINSGLNIQYTEKRIKALCDKAINRSNETFVLILDDIDRVNAGALLGNVLYAMEYRDQKVDLVDGNALIIPNNVIIIITEGIENNGNELDYALRRRLDYIKELKSDRSIIEKYYISLNNNIQDTILEIYDDICTFIKSGIIEETTKNLEKYIPGHGMFVIDINGTVNDILTNYKNKLIYQVLPYVKELKNNGIINNDIEQFSETILNKINVGETDENNIVSVEKILINSQQVLGNFSLNDSKDYFENTILTNGCVEHRGIIENIVDAIFTNGILSYDIAMADVLKNTNVVRFQDRTNVNNAAAFIVETIYKDNFWYQTTNAVPRTYYSINATRTGRWNGKNDAPAYKLTFKDGRKVDYVSLNALRNSGFDVKTVVIHASENTASIYIATYKLVDAYFDSYIKNLKLMQSFNSNSNLSNLYEFVQIEKSFLSLVNYKVNKITGGNNKLKYLCENIHNLECLWKEKNTVIYVNQKIFHNLLNGKIELSVDTYYDLFSYNNGEEMSITIEGVEKMADLKNYQQIMENLGVRQMVFQGPPGTSKTFESKKFVLKQLNAQSSVLSQSLPTQTEISDALESFKLTDSDYKDPSNSNKLQTGGWDLVQFHPSYSYEDFIRGIEVKPVGGVPTYSSVNRILGKIAEFAKIAENSQNGDNPKFYLIIDEINRANLATVFGELIYGLEYRDSKVSTPYEVSDVNNVTSKDIVIGKNLYIIGTMNTADKSIDAIDYAIRRRFLFIDSPASREVVVNCYKNTMSVDDEKSIELVLFDAVCRLFEGDLFFNNEYQRSDVQLGHTYFLRTNDVDYLQICIEKFIYQVIPILREYIKDGILETTEELLDIEVSVDEIITENDYNIQINLIAQKIMMFINNFNDKNKEGIIINNDYILKFIIELNTKLNY